MSGSWDHNIRNRDKLKWLDFCGSLGSHVERARFQHQRLVRSRLGLCNFRGIEDQHLPRFGDEGLIRGFGYKMGLVMKKIHLYSSFVCQAHTD